MRTAAVAATLVALFASAAFADGKFYWREQVSPDVPYQRALLMFDGEHEALVLQSQYAAATSDAPDDIAWVVPVPAVPELASMESRQADWLFSVLSLTAQPHVIEISLVLSLFVPIACGVVLLLLCALSESRPRLSWIAAHRWPVAMLALFVIFVPVLCLTPSLGGRRGVEVLKSESVGIYDAKVVSSSDAGELVGWLNEKGFQFQDADEAVFRDYVSRGWCFVTAHVRPDAASEHQPVNGLADPLILRFPTKEAVYPLALTGTTGHETEVLIYILSKTKMLCGDRLRLKHAGEASGSSIRRLLRVDNEAAAKLLADAGLYYVTKFKSRLSPSQMETDLTFTSAADNNAYRALEVVW